MSLRVAVILNRKGHEVLTILPDASLVEAVQKMADHNVGALVVSADGRTVAGIITERDLVRRVARLGLESLEAPVSEAMTAEVLTCTPENTIGELMATMTQQRTRHIPVVVDDEIFGIVSIGDVVKSRLDELEVQATTLEQYITGSLS